MISESSAIDESSLETVLTLGQGGFGSVSLERDSNFRFYAKKSSSLKLLNNLQKELNIMLRFRNHPRIVQASSPVVYLGSKPESSCYIYMEFASKGTLHNVISEFRGRSMPENMIGCAARMILQGLEALHSHGYVHCDIKPANVLVFPSKTDMWDLKLADFGLSKEPFTDYYSRSSYLAGTKKYMPPECVGPNATKGVIIGPGFDIWSLGCVVLEMYGVCPQKIRDGYYVWSLPKVLSPVAEDFLKRCLAFTPSRRATAAKLLNHPFVAQRVMSTVPIRHGVLPHPSFLRFPSVTRNKVMEEVY